MRLPFTGTQSRGTDSSAQVNVFGLTPQLSNFSLWVLFKSDSWFVRARNGPLSVCLSHSALLLALLRHWASQAELCQVTRLQKGSGSSLTPFCLAAVVW